MHYMNYNLLQFFYFKFLYIMVIQSLLFIFRFSCFFPCNDFFINFMLFIWKTAWFYFYWISTLYPFGIYSIIQFFNYITNHNLLFPHAFCSENNVSFLFHLPIHSSIHSFILTFDYLFIHSFIYLFIYSFIYLFIYLFLICNCI